MVMILGNKKVEENGDIKDAKPCGSMKDRNPKRDFESLMKELEIAKQFSVSKKSKKWEDEYGGWSDQEWGYY